MNDIKTRFFTGTVKNPNKRSKYKSFVIVTVTDNATATNRRPYIKESEYIEHFDESNTTTYTVYAWYREGCDIRWIQDFQNSEDAVVFLTELTGYNKDSKAWNIPGKYNE